MGREPLIATVMATASPINNSLCSLSQSGPLILTLIVLAPSLSGCDAGYKVNTSRNTVTWVTWDEGRGRREWPVAGADAKTFQVMPIPSNGATEFGRDKTHVYLGAERINGAAPDSFREFGPRAYRDDKSVFRPNGSTILQLPDSDPETYREFDWLWSRDAKRVFFENRGFVPRDIDSFEPLADGWGRDRVAVYYWNSEIPKADRATFEVIGEWSPFGKDRAHVFWRGWLIDGADPHSFAVLGVGHGHDHKTHFEFIPSEVPICGPDYPASDVLEIRRRSVEQIKEGKKP